MDDFQTEMFNTTFLFTETNVPHEIGWGLELPIPLALGLSG